jgi:hypothetical protein
MPATLFELTLTEGPARRLHERGEGGFALQVPWSSLDPSRYPPAVAADARLRWTRQAFTEHCSTLAMARLVDLLGQVRAPLDLWSLAASFPPQEIAHTELCARMAMALGGGGPLPCDPETLAPPPGGSLSPLQRASEQVVRLCAIEERLSFAVMAERLRRASHPVSRAVLERLVRDEALHGRFAALFLDWLDLTPAERSRLRRVAEEALGALRAELDARLPPDPDAEHRHALGWISREAHRETALRALEEDIVPLLGRYGLAP